MLREKNMQIGQRDKRIGDLEKETRRLHDLIYLKNFGVQVFDSVPQAQPEPEPELTPEQEAEQQDLSERDYEKARLTSLKRTRPSSLGPAIAALQQRDLVRAAHAARPEHPAMAVFAEAREQANSN